MKKTIIALFASLAALVSTPARAQVCETACGCGCEIIESTEDTIWNHCEEQTDANMHPESPYIDKKAVPYNCWSEVPPKICETYTNVWSGVVFTCCFY